MAVPTDWSFLVLFAPILKKRRVLEEQQGRKQETELIRLDDIRFRVAQERELGGVGGWNTPRIKYHCERHNKGAPEFCHS